ncbi:uncharacterized protein LOC122261260 [Penaeus japonicus]|uniref:uncharacterized protein LOC122261260 n=1 Tax=Penaeus japonicus TaxID=27405 RepID=UPI001C712F15|nr:uncharacterized protein LOC122261260 [Penaeus japonicus]
MSHKALRQSNIWRRQEKTRGRLGHLVQSHCHLVSLVRETEAIFGPMLQCYYASTVVILCTELYLLAYRIGSKDYSLDSVVTTGLLTLQTAAVFVQVSLAAGAVEEEASDSVDVLRRGLPFSTSERDRFSTLMGMHVQMVTASQSNFMTPALVGILTLYMKDKVTVT